MKLIFTEIRPLFLLIWHSLFAWPLLFFKACFAECHTLFFPYPPNNNNFSKSLVLILNINYINNIKYSLCVVGVVVINRTIWEYIQNACGRYNLYRIIRARPFFRHPPPLPPGGVGYRLSAQPPCTHAGRTPDRIIPPHARSLIARRNPSCAISFVLDR